MSTISAGASTYTISASGATYSLASGLTRGSAGALQGVKVTGNNDVVTNSGTMVGGTYSAPGYFGGIVVYGSGVSVTNQAGGYLHGAGENTDGVAFGSTFGTVVNAGRIVAAGGPPGDAGDGVGFFQGGILTNLSTGTISGNGVFVAANGEPQSTIVNSGVILGGTVYGGIFLGAGGTITNLAGGTISAGGGAYGIMIANAAGTITNSGTINGSVNLGSNTANLVADDPGAVFSGQVVGGDGELELASGSSIGTLSAVPANFTNFSTLVLDSGASWLIDGGASLGSEFSTIAGFSAADTIQVSGDDSISNQSTSGGATHITLTGASPMTLNFAGALPSLQASYSGGVTNITEVVGPTLTTGGTVAFTAHGTGVVLDPTAAIIDTNNVTSATIWIANGFVQGDTLSFANETGITGSFNATTGTLVFTGNTSAAAFQTALDSVTFGFSLSDGDPSQAGNKPTRTIDWQVADSSGSSSLTNSTVITNLSSVLTYAQTIEETGIVATSETVSGNVMTLLSSGVVGHVTVGSSLNNTGDFLLSSSGGNTTIVVDTVFGTYNSTVTLLTNPTTIAPTAKINGTVSGGAGVFGGAGTSWTLTNQGQVIETGTNSYGVSLAGSGTVFNAGTISAPDNVGVKLNSGYVSNAAGGLISGYNGGVLAIYGSVTNAGMVSATKASAFGIQFLNDGGTINNSGVVNGGEYGLVFDGTGAVTNSGTVIGGRFALESRAGVSINNTGTLFGGNQGIALFSQGGPSTVTNSGQIVGASGLGVGYSAGFITNSATIFGTYQSAIILSAGGAVTNNAGGLIKSNPTYTGLLLYGGTTANVVNSGVIIGYTGVQFFNGTTNSAPATLTNSGTILGTGAIAVAFGTANDLFILEGTAPRIQGRVDGGGGTNTLEFASGAGTGTLTGAGAYFANFGTGTVDAGARWTLAGGVTLGSTVTLTNSGTLTDVGTLVNAGLVTGSAQAIVLGAGGLISNQAGGTINGGGGFAVYGSGAGTVVNAGSILSSTEDIYLTGGGSVTNQSGGTISGANGIRLYDGGTVSNQSGGTITAYRAISDRYGSVAVVNAGVIAGGTAGVDYGIFAGHYGTVINQSGGVISGYAGVVIAANGTVVNSGTIASSQGDVGTAVSFTGGNARLIESPTATLIGSVYGGRGGTAVLELASGASAGTITGLGTSITNFTSLVFDPGSQWTVEGNGSANGLGTLAIQGFTIGDTIDLTGFVAVSSTFSSNTLTLTNGTGAHETLHVTGTFTTANVHLTSDGNGGTDIYLQPVPTIAAGATANFTGGGSPVVLDGSIVITDPNGTLLSNATIEINSSSFANGDVLAFNNGTDTETFTDGTTITASYNAADGELTLSGTSSIQNYESALDSVTYSFNPGTGDPTSGGGDLSRSIDWIVNDATGTSVMSLSSLDVIHAPPALIASGTVGYGIGGGPVALDQGITLSDPDSNDILTGATVAIAGGFLSRDELSVDGVTIGLVAATNITVSYDASDGVLTLTGIDTLQHYEQVLKEVEYSSSASDPSEGGGDPTRTITWVVDDDSSSNGVSNIGTTGLDFAQPPVISGAVAGQTTTDESAIDPLSGVTITDPNVGQTETVVVTLSNSANGTLSDVIGGTVNNGTYVVTGSTLFVTQALDALVFTPIAHQVAPGDTVTTTITIAATSSDGATDRNSTASVIVTANNDSPQVSITSINTGVPNQDPLSPFADLTITDPDVGGHIGTLTVALAPSDGGTLSVLSGGTFDAATGVYTLVGTISALSTALEDLVFTPAPPSDGSDLSTTDFTIEVTDSGGEAIDNDVTVTTVTQVLGLSTVPGGDDSISVSPDGTGFPAADPGKTNEAVISAPTTGGAYSLPGGYQAGFLGGTADASLSDTTSSGALLVGNSGNDTISASTANDTLTGGGGSNLFSVSGANDVIGVTGASTVRTSGSNDAVYADASTLALSDSGTNDALGLSSGTASVTLSGSGANVYGGSGSASVLDDGSDDAIGAGTGPVMATLGGSGTRVYGGSNTLTVDVASTASGIEIGPGSGAAAVTVAGGSTTIYGGSGSLNADVTGSNTRIGLANGPAAITLSGSGAEIFGGSNTLQVDDLGTSDTIAASTGSATVTAAGSSAVIVGGGGNLQLIGGANNATVYAGTGSTTITGGSGAMTLYGGAGGLIDVDGGGGLITYQAGPGSETLDAAAASRASIINGGIDRSGDDVLTGGSGNDSLFAGNGSDTFTGGGGSNEFVFYQAVINGAAPHDVITDFNSNDVVYLGGYGAAAAANALSTASSSNGSTTLTLSDNTQITFLDIASATNLVNHVVSF